MFAGSISFLSWTIHSLLLILLLLNAQQFVAPKLILRKYYNVSSLISHLPLYKLVNLIYYYDSPYGIPCKLLSTGFKLLNLSYFFIQVFAFYFCIVAAIKSASHADYRGIRARCLPAADRVHSHRMCDITAQDFAW